MSLPTHPPPPPPPTTTTTISQNLSIPPPLTPSSMFLKHPENKIRTQSKKHQKIIINQIKNKIRGIDCFSFVISCNFTFKDTIISCLKLIKRQ